MATWEAYFGFFVVMLVSLVHCNWHDRAQPAVRLRLHDRSDEPLRYGEMAWLLPRGDVVLKAW